MTIVSDPAEWRWPGAVAAAAQEEVSQWINRLKGAVSAVEEWLGWIVGNRAFKSAARKAQASSNNWGGREEDERRQLEDGGRLRLQDIQTKEERIIRWNWCLCINLTNYYFLALIQSRVQKKSRKALEGTYSPSLEYYQSL